MIRTLLIAVLLFGMTGCKEATPVRDPAPQESEPTEHLDFHSYGLLFHF